MIAQGTQNLHNLNKSLEGNNADASLAGTGSAKQSFFDFPREIRDNIYFHFIDSQLYSRQSNLFALTFVPLKGCLEFERIDEGVKGNPTWPDACLISTARSIATEYLDAYFYAAELRIWAENVVSCTTKPCKANEHISHAHLYRDIRFKLKVPIQHKSAEKGSQTISSNAPHFSTFQSVVFRLENVLRRVRIVRILEWDHPMLPVAMSFLPNLTKIEIEMSITVYRDVSLRDGSTRSIPANYKAYLTFFAQRPKKDCVVQEEKWANGNKIKLIHIVGNPMGKFDLEAVHKIVNDYKKVKERLFSLRVDLLMS